MRRFRLPLLIFVTLIVAMLFFGDFLTGRVHYEFQNPYTRSKKIVESKFGFHRETIQPHQGMEELYYTQLKQPRKEIWKPSGNSFKVEKLTGRQVFVPGPVAPVMFLEPDRELEFLHMLPSDAARRAVIHSLFQPRKISSDPEIVAANERLTRQESERVRTISLWYEFDRKNYSITPMQWWLKNAHIFGIRPDGSSLAPVAASVRSKPSQVRE
jgi:hypothetical protein